MPQSGTGDRGLGTGAPPARHRLRFCEQGGVLGRQSQRAGGDVLGEVVRVAGARDGEDVRAPAQGPRQAELGRGHAVGPREVAYRRALLGDPSGLLARARDREEGDEGDALLAARVEEGVLLGGEPIP